MLAFDAARAAAGPCCRPVLLQPGKNVLHSASLRKTVRDSTRDKLAPDLRSCGLSLPIETRHNLRALIESKGRGQSNGGKRVVSKRGGNATAVDGGCGGGAF